MPWKHNKCYGVGDDKVGDIGVFGLCWVGSKSTFISACHEELLWYYHWCVITVILVICCIFKTIIIYLH